MNFVKEDRNKNNRGVALVSVLIVITLIGILASSILNLSYLAYERKSIEKKTNENFYANEAVIDTVKAVLQNAAASVLTEVDDSDEFAEAAKKAIENVVTNDANSTTLEEYLFNYVVSTMSSDSTGTDVERAITSVDDGGNGGSFSVGAIVMGDDGETLYIKDVVVEYVNDEGYTSIIITDIVLRSPVYASNENNPLGSYSMMCGDGASFSGSGQGWKNTSNQTGYVRHEGNIYIGAQTSGGAIQSTATTISDGLCLEFSGDNVVINGDVYVTEGSILLLNAESIEIKGTIYLTDESTLLIGPNCDDLVIKDINVDGKSFTSGAYTGGSTTKISEYEYFPLTQYVESGSIQSYFDTTGLSLLYGTNSGSSKIAVYDYYEYVNESDPSVTQVEEGYYLVSVKVVDGVNHLYYTTSKQGDVLFSETKTSTEDTVTLTSSEKILFDETLSQTPLASNGVDAEVSSRIDIDVLNVYASIMGSTWLPQRYISTEDADNDGVDDGDSAVTDAFSETDIALKEDGKLYISTLSSISSGQGSASTFKYLASEDDTTASTLPVTINIGNITNVENANTMSLALYISTNNITVPMNSGSEYCGIYLSVGSVTFTNNEGLGRGTSFLEMDKSDGYAYAKKWCKQVGYLIGYWQSDWTSADTSYTYGSYTGYYRLVNNLFHGGYAALYESLEDGGSSGSSITVKEDNSDASFVVTENWSKE